MNIVDYRIKCYTYILDHFTINLAGVIWAERGVLEHLNCYWGEKSLFAGHITCTSSSTVIVVATSITSVVIVAVVAVVVV